MSVLRKAPPSVLVFSATDPSGGAGIQADILTIASIGCHPLPIITAITVQNTSGVEGVLPIDSDWVVDQARVILEDIPVAAFKIGVMGSIENIAGIAEITADYPDIPLILDPVLSSARGDDFTNEDMLDAIKTLLIPQSTVVTPNTIELKRLVQDEDADIPLEQLALRLVNIGAEYVLTTGTHDQIADVINALYNEKGIVRRDTWKRLPASYHGSGCTLASAIAASIANGATITNAVYSAQAYTWQTLAHGFRPGMGQFVPHRLFWERNDTNESLKPPSS